MSVVYRYLLLLVLAVPYSLSFAGEPENLALSEDGWMGDLWGKWNIDRIDTLMTDGYTFNSTGLPGPVDKETTKAVVAAYKAAMPDLVVTTDEAHASGDVVFFVWTAKGTLTGEMNGIQPTGKPFEVKGSTLHTFEDGKIASTFMRFDMLELLQQVEAL